MLILIREAAKKWHISERRVRALARQGRIKNSYFINRRWFIDENSPKPTLTEYKNSLEERKYPPFTFTNGEFGKLGGMYLPNSFKKFFDPMQAAFVQMISTSAFDRQMRDFVKTTPLYVPENFNKTLGNVKVSIKREDLNTARSLYINQAYPFAKLLKRLKKEKLLLAAGNASFAEAYAEACTKLKIPYKIFIAYKDYKKQKAAFDALLKKYNPNFLYICERDASLFDAVNYAFRQYLYNDAKDLYVLTDAIGPAPIPQIVEYCQSAVGHSAQIQLKRMGITKLNAIVAPANVGSNALGIFAGAKSTTSLVLVESSDSNSVMKRGHVSGVDGMMSLTLTSPGYCECEEKPLCAAMSFPALSPKLAFGYQNGKYHGVGVTDKEALLACKEFFELEGIFPALEDGYCLAYIKRRAKKMKNGTILMCFTADGEKDRDFVFETLREE